MVERIRRPLAGEYSWSAPVTFVELTIIGHYNPAIPSPRFLPCLGVYPALGNECYHLTGKFLDSLIRYVNASLGAEGQFELGTFAIGSSVKASFSGKRFFQRHAAIWGSTGSGKSSAVALLLQHISTLPGANVILFDVNGEYRPIEGTDAVNYQRLRIAGPGDLRYPAPDVIFLPYWLLSHNEIFSIIGEIDTETALNQKWEMSTRILELKQKWCERYNLSHMLPSLTLDSPIPFCLNELSKSFGEKYSTMEAPKKRMAGKVADPRNGFMFQPPSGALEPGWLVNFAHQLLGAGDQSAGIKIIDFSEVPSDLLPIATSTLARLLYRIQYWAQEADRIPVCLICEQAHLYMSSREPSGSRQAGVLEAFERIAQEGRKYGVSLLVVSQRPSDVSTTILSQCSNTLTFRLTNQQDQSVIRRLLPDGLQNFADTLPVLQTGEAILIGDAVAFPTRIRLDVPSSPPTSVTGDSWLAWKSRSNSRDLLSTAVTNLRCQSRGATTREM